VKKVLLSTAIVLIALFPNSSKAASVGLTNPYFRSWNGVLVGTPEDDFSTFIESGSVTSGGTSASRAADVGFATVDAHSERLVLHAAASVDADGIDSLGYDKVIAEATTRYEADLVLTGGSGFIELIVSSSHTETSFSNEPGFSYTGTGSIRIHDGSGYIFGMSARTESAGVVLAYGVTYRFDMSLTASTRASPGNQTSVTRDIVVSLDPVPEPSTGTLMILGLAMLSLQRGTPRYVRGRPRG
jgi:hypothetical protein